MDLYRDRQDAGEVLADQLIAYKNNPNVFVLALPRGGVPVAFEVAKKLNAPLDVFIVRKLGVPGYEELAMGAIAAPDVVVFNDSIVKAHQVSPAAIQRVIAEEKTELARRELKYRGNRPFPELKNKIIILVDDGIATGATMRAAIQALHQAQAEKIILAVPVADAEVLNQFRMSVDQAICPHQPEYLTAVGAWYEKFDQTSDEEVYTLLQQAKEFVVGKG